MAARFWVGGTGNADGVTTTHWSATSGGAGGASVPGAADDVTFNASSGGGTVTFTAGMTVLSITSGAFTGTIDTNGQTIVTSGAFNNGGAGTRTLTLGASSITCSQFSNTGSGLTFNCGTSTITTALLTSVAGLTYATVVISNGVSPNTFPQCTIGTLTLSPSSASCLRLSGDIVVTTAFNPSGANAGAGRLIICSDTDGTTRTITAAAITAVNTDWRDIVAAGAASWNLSAATGGSGNAGGCTGITFTTGATMFWLHGASASYNWSDATRWFLATNGGGGAGRMPLCQDVARFDANSFPASGKTVAFDLVATGGGTVGPRIGGFDWTGAINSPTFGPPASRVTVYGSFTYVPGVTITASSGFGLEPYGGATSTVRMNGGTLSSVPFRMGGPGSTGSKVVLGDNFTCSTLTLVAGEFDAAGFDVTFTTCNSTGTVNRVVKMGSGTWRCPATSGTVMNIVVGGFFTLDPGTSTLRLTGALASPISLNLGGQTFWNFRNETTGVSAVQFTGTQTFNDFYVDASAAARTILFTAGTTTTVSSFSRDGGTNIITIGSITAANHNLVKAGALSVISLDYISVSRSQATPGTGTWYAGQHSTNGGNNSGWIFTAPPAFLPVSQWALTIAASPVAMRFVRRLNVDPSAVALAFSPVGLLRPRALLVGSAALAITPAAVTLRTTRKIPVAPFTVVISAQAVTLRKGKGIAVDPTAITITFAAVGLTYEFTLRRDSGRLALGLFSGFKDFDGRMDATASRLGVAVRARAGKLATGFSVHSGATYVCPMDVSFDGASKDVVGVVLKSEELVRRSSLAGCIATPGSYFYDPDAEFTSDYWDSSSWDTMVWDRFRALYVHLADETSPNLQPIVAEIGFWFGEGGFAVPTLGADVLAGIGLFETGAGDPTGWTKSNLGIAGGTWGASRFTGVVFDTLQPRRGSWAVIVYGGSAYGGRQYRTTSPVTVTPGARYQLSGLYWSQYPSPPPGQSISLSPAGYMSPTIRVNDAVTEADVMVDGRTWGRGYLPLDAYAGEWHSFTLDFIAPDSGSIYLYFGASSSSAGAIAAFDEITLRRVYRIEPAEARLLEGSVPSGGHGSQDTLFGGRQVGVGGITLNNADGLMEKLFAPGLFDWIGRTIDVYAGDHDVPFFDWRKQYSAHVTALPAIKDDSVDLNVADAFGFYSAKVSPNVFSAEDYSALDKRFEGAVKPQWWGRVEGVEPIGIAKNANGYRTYLLADMTYALNGFISLTEAYAYESEQAATAADPSARVGLGGGTDLTQDYPTGTITIVRDVTVLRVGIDETLLDMNLNGVIFSIAIPPGLYLRWSLAAAVSNAIQTATGWIGTWCSYSETTHKFTFTWGGGPTLELLTKTGATVKAGGLWTLLGFETDADKTGALTYEGDVAVFDPAEVDSVHILRVNGTGYKDDALGTYTGTPLAPIEKLPDIVRHVWRKHLGRPASSIDDASFVAARVTAPELLWVYLADTITAKDFFNRMEQTMRGDLVVDGDGVLYCTPYESGSAGAVALFDADYLSWSCYMQDRDTFSNLTVTFAQDPATGVSKTRSRQSSGTAVRFSRNEKREIPTYLSNVADAQACLEGLGAWADAPRLVAGFTVSGKLLRARVGTKVILTRNRAATLTGTLVAVVFRITSINHDALGRSAVVAVQDL